VSPEPKLRADARRNRDLVLAAAREAFAEAGGAVPLDEIARRAGVGAGTVYRHFPTKEALLRAVIVARLEELTEQARTLLAADDPGEAFFGYAAHVIAEGSVKHDLVDALTSTGAAFDLAGLPVSVAFRTALHDLLARAQQAGAARQDLTGPELTAVLTGASLAARANRADPRLNDRARELVLDALRPRS
jgi:AcrR family transcriptional regulator